jgi:hypothetical protein
MDQTPLAFNFLST